MQTVAATDPKSSIWHFPMESASTPNKGQILTLKQETKAGEGMDIAAFSSHMHCAASWAYLWKKKQSEGTSGTMTAWYSWVIFPKGVRKLPVMSKSTLICGIFPNAKHQTKGVEARRNLWRHRTEKTFMWIGSIILCLFPEQVLPNNSNYYAH